MASIPELWALLPLPFLKANLPISFGVARKAEMLIIKSSVWFPWLLHHEVQETLCKKPVVLFCP